MAENQIITVHYKEKTDQPVVGIVDRSHRHEFLVFDLTLEQKFYTKIYGIYTPTKSYFPIEVSLAYESKLIKDEHFSVNIDYSDNDSLAILQGQNQKVWITFKIKDKGMVKNGDQIKFRISNVKNGLIANAKNGLINELTMTIKK